MDQYLCRVRSGRLGTETTRIWSSASCLLLLLLLLFLCLFVLFLLLLPLLRSIAVRTATFAPPTSVALYYVPFCNASSPFSPVFFFFFSPSWPICLLFSWLRRALPGFRAVLTCSPVLQPSTVAFHCRSSVIPLVWQCLRVACCNRPEDLRPLDGACFAPCHLAFALNVSPFGFAAN